MAPMGIFLGVFFLVAFTVSDYGVTWDEPAYFHASDLHSQWMDDFGKNLFNGRIGRSLDDETIKAAWHWDPYHVPHPPFSRILSGLTKAAFTPVIDKFVAYRLAPAMFFALLATIMFLWMTAIFDRVTGFFCALMLVLIPNLFGFAHFAVTDMPLTGMWFLTVYCFWRGLKDWKWSLVLGVIWGLALSTKFTALLIPIPILVWAHLYHRQSYSNNLFAMIFLSPIVMIACQPYLWHQTSIRILEFLFEGLSRGYRPETSFPIFFFNKIYDTGSIPWYYPFFMTAVTIPEAVLVLCMVGVMALYWVKPQRKVMILFLFNAVFILCMGLLPGAVLHDTTRQLLPVNPFLVGVAGYGFFLLVSYLAERCQRITVLQRINHLRAKIISVLFSLFLFPQSVDLLFYHPFELSYYNRLIGGVRGAFERGLEVTYFMEAFTPDFLRFLNEKVPRDATINASFANFMFEFYQKEGRLRPDIKITDKQDFDYHILLNRRSVLSQSDRALLRHASRPIASVTVGGMPLVFVYKAKELD